MYPQMKTMVLFLNSKLRKWRRSGEAQLRQFFQCGHDFRAPGTFQFRPKMHLKITPKVSTQKPLEKMINRGTMRVGFSPLQPRDTFAPSTPSVHVQITEQQTAPDKTTNAEGGNLNDEQDTDQSSGFPHQGRSQKFSLGR